MKAKILTYTEGEDPKAVVTENVGNSVENIKVFGNRVLVATAPHCEKSKGGIIYTDNKKDEGKYQGKVGLVLKIGDNAFNYDGPWEWVGSKPEVGSWVFYRNSDSWECGVNGVSCRFIRDEYIVGEVNGPEDIW